MEHLSVRANQAITFMSQRALPGSIHEGAARRRP